jgi:hypothetical protein
MALGHNDKYEEEDERVKKKKVERKEFAAFLLNFFFLAPIL